MAKISIVITTYNGLTWLPRAILCAINQDFGDHEVIVVNDGSQDGTREFLDMLQLPGVRVIHHEDNQGLPTACNTGIAAAQGEFVMRCDDDDFLSPTILRETYERIHGSPEVGFVYTDYFLADERGETTDTIELPDYCEEVIHHRDLIATGLLIRKSLLEQVGLFDVAMKSQEVYDLLIRLQQRAVGRHVGRPLFWYTRRAGQMTENLDRLRDYTSKIQEKYGLDADGMVKW